jgi:citrate lyase beta subunit
MTAASGICGKGICECLLDREQNQRSNTVTKEDLAYRVGSLLYVPALNHKAIGTIVGKGIHGAMSIAFCLEDSIVDSAVGLAESKVLETITVLSAKKANDEEAPLYFIRVRGPEQMKMIAESLKGALCALCGFIIPKFDLSNAHEYIQAIQFINDELVGNQTVYFLPVLETPSIAFVDARRETLARLKELFVSSKKYVLNIRIGGNDLCHIFGVRVGAGQTIYDIGMIRDVLSDVMSYFGSEFVLSAPTSNYFADGLETNGSQWKDGVKREIRLDIANGFIGKTAIHPSQIPIINKAFMVSWHDYYDAQQIINWTDGELAVAKSVAQQRMNEKKIHSNWAKKIILRANAYGIREQRAYE